MNPILILTHNCLDLTKRCVDSLRQQDIPIAIHLYDSGSSDETVSWAEAQPDIRLNISVTNRGVSAGWNFVLRQLFNFQDQGPADHCLVINNDTVFPSWFYRRLIATTGDFVTGVSVGSMDEIATEPPIKKFVEAPDFSAFLIRRVAWETIGPFDDTMAIYASDLDYHIRAWRKGVHLWNAGIPFYHERSSTLNLATPKDRRMIQLQADADRERLTEKWGCRAGDDSYKAMFSLDTFGVDANHEVSEATNER